MKIQAFFACLLATISSLIYGAAEQRIPPLNEMPEPALEIIGAYLHYTDLGNLAETSRRLAAFFRSELGKQKQATELSRYWKKPITSVLKEKIIRRPIKAVAFSPNGKLIACPEQFGFSLRDAETGKKVSERFDRGQVSNSLTFFQPDNSKLQLIDISTNYIHIWNIMKECADESYYATMSEILRIPSNYHSAAAFFPESKVIAAGFPEGTVSIWTKDNKNMEFSNDNNYEITALRFSPDGKLLAIGTASGCMYIWAWRTGKITKMIPENDTIPENYKYEGHSKVSFVSFSPDQKYVAATFDQTVQCHGGFSVWNLITNEESVRCGPGDYNFVSLAFSPDSRIIAAVAENGPVQLFGIKSALNKSLPDEGYSYKMYPVFSPDGKSIAAATSEGFCKLWRATNQSS